LHCSARTHWLWSMRNNVTHRLKVLGCAPGTGYLIALALLSACRPHAQIVATNPSLALSPTCTDAVAVYAERANVPYDYYEVGIITGEGNSAYTGNGELLKAMRGKAAVLGANGVIVNSLGATHATVKVIGAAVGSNDAERKGQVIAIWMPSDTLRVREACGKG
jgi:hypothetical protein